MSIENLDMDAIQSAVAEGLNPTPNNPLENAVKIEEKPSEIIDNEDKKSELKFPDKPVETPKASEQKAQEVPANTEPNPEPSTDIITEIYGNLTNALGVELTEDELASIEFTDDINAITPIVSKLTEKVQNNAVQSLYGKYPDLQKVITHLDVYGSLDGFEATATNPLATYTTLDVTDVANQKAIYSKSLELKGLGESEIKDLLELAEDKNQLATKASEAQKAFGESIKQSEEKQFAENQRIVQERKEAQEKLYTEVTNTINAGKLLGVNLSNAEKVELRDYLMKPIGKDEFGNPITAKDIAHSKLTIEQELFIERLIQTGFKGFQVENPKTRSLRDMFKSNENRASATTAGKGESKSVDVAAQTQADIDLDFLKEVVQGK